jgi:hypothetical protein
MMGSPGAEDRRIMPIPAAITNKLVGTPRVTLTPARAACRSRRLTLSDPAAKPNPSATAIEPLTATIRRYLLFQARGFRSWNRTHRCLEDQSRASDTTIVVAHTLSIDRRCSCPYLCHPSSIFWTLYAVWVFTYTSWEWFGFCHDSCLGGIIFEGWVALLNPRTISLGARLLPEKENPCIRRDFSSCRRRIRTFAY